MLQRFLQVHADPQGKLVGGVRTNEVLTAFALLGWRRRVYTGMVVLSGARSGDRVLDVGCSGGYLAFLRHRRVRGFSDRPGGSVNTGNRLCAGRAPRRCNFVVDVVQCIQFPDCSFDVVTLILAIHHVPEDHRSRAFCEVYRVTRPGGRLLVADASPSSCCASRQVEKRHKDRVLLEELATAAGFYVKKHGNASFFVLYRECEPGRG